jgi:hypothetical protein
MIHSLVCCGIEKQSLIMTKSSSGSIDRGHLLDIVFDGEPPGGPFPSVKDFNDWFSRLPSHKFPNSQNIEDPYRTFLPDTGIIKLTHGDLHRGNIIISSTSPPLYTCNR